MKLNRLFLAVLLPLAANATPNRGLWFWGSTNIPDGLGGVVDSPYGSNLVVGDSLLERDCLAFFKLHHVKRLCGSYGNRPISEQATIADWNEKLDCLGIDSQSIFRGIDTSLPAFKAELLDRVQVSFINFMDAIGTDDPLKFKALRLQITPKKDFSWTAWTPAFRRA